MSFVPTPHEFIVAPSALSDVMVYSSRSLDAVMLISEKPALSNCF